MIQGVHATLSLFRPFGEALGVLNRNWEEIGRPGPFGSRRVRLEGSPPQDFLLRVTDEAGVSRTRTHSWRLMLFTPDQAMSTAQPAVDAAVILEAVTKDACGLRLNGRQAHDLNQRGLGNANAYARALLSELDTAMQQRGSPRGAPAVARTH
jgi:hypothetical protein